MINEVIPKLNGSARVQQPVRATCIAFVVKIPKLPSRFSTTNDEDNGHDVCDVELEDSDDADDDDEVDDEDEDVAE